MTARDILIYTWFFIFAALCCISVYRVIRSPEDCIDPKKYPSCAARHRKSPRQFWLIAGVWIWLLCFFWPATFVWLLLYPRKQP